MDSRERYIVKSGLAWIVVGVIIGVAFYPVVVEAQQYFGKFPPTPAWQEIDTDDNAVINNFSQPFLNATSYNDRFFIISDGSIDIFFTEYP